MYLQLPFVYAKHLFVFIKIVSTFEKHECNARGANQANPVGSDSSRSQDWAVKLVGMISTAPRYSYHVASPEEL